MTTSSVALEIIDDQSQISVVVQETGIQLDSAKTLHTSFAPFFREAKEVLTQSRQVVVTDVSQALQMKLARQFRLALRSIRLNGEKTRKSLQENAAKQVKACNGFYHILDSMISTEETRLDDAEKFALKKEEERKAGLKLQREEALKPYGLDTSFMDLGAMPDASFAMLLENSRAAAERKIEEARKAEQAWIEAENARLKEEARIRDENLALKKQAEEREESARVERLRLQALAEVERQKAETARKEAEAEAKRLKDEADEKIRFAELKARTDAIKAKAIADEAARVAAEDAQRILRENATVWEAKRKAEQDAAFAAAEVTRKKVEAEKAKMQETTRKASEAAALKLKEERIARQQLQDRLDKEEAFRKQEEAARLEHARADALAPDRFKLNAYVKAIAAIQVPELVSEAGKAVASNLNQRREAYLAYVDKIAATL